MLGRKIFEKEKHARSARMIHCTFTAIRIFPTRDEASVRTSRKHYEFPEEVMLRNKCGLKSFRNAESAPDFKLRKNEEGERKILPIF